ncbi:MAG: hypothetical protein K9J13_09315 [Saprospiraceae bacterium]|nr:hypothetical protein [Saprospiraceae bacterium]
MKNLFKIAIIGILITVMISCQKEQVKEKKTSDSSSIAYSAARESGGYWIWEEDWVGWLDPQNGETYDPDQIYLKTDPKFWGEVVYDDEDNPIGIVCPMEGNCCGKLYHVCEFGITYVGWYINWDV